MEDPQPPASVALLARALFSLEALIEARSTLLRLEPRAEPDAVWKAANLLYMRAQLITDLMEPLLHDEQQLWDAIRWIRGAGQEEPRPCSKP
jgi:hypothetical protein